MTPLPQVFLDRPVAHRGLHDASQGRIENARASFDAAVAAGYGIELDVQISRDGVPVVFHDYTLDRLTTLSGPVRDRSAEELAGISLSGSDDTIETLQTVLERIGPVAPVLVEIKDQSHLPGTDIAALDQVTGWGVKNAMESHGLQAAIMSFNPGYAAALSWLVAAIPRGLVGMVFDEPSLTAAENAALTDYAAFDTSGASFVSHDRATLDTPSVTRLKAQGVPIFTWTIRSAEEEATARKVADNITFEGYTPG